MALALEPYSPQNYTPDRLGYWIETARRQQAKDRVLLPRLSRHFKPGRLLELGAGAGQSALMLRDMGWDVVATDYAEFFVDHLRTLGLVAHQVDATDIAAADIGSFANVFCQSISPFITTDVNIIASAYRSVYSSLEPGGRLVLIHAQASRSELRETMRTHAAQASAAGFKDIRVVRNQLLPSVAYRAPMTPLAAVAESCLGQTLGVRFVVFATR